MLPCYASFVSTFTFINLHCQETMRFVNNGGVIAAFTVLMVKPSTSIVTCSSVQSSYLESKKRRPGTARDKFEQVSFLTLVKVFYNSPELPDRFVVFHEATCKTA